MSRTKRVSTKIVIDIATGAVEHRESHDYSGQFALCEGEEGDTGDTGDTDDKKKDTQTETVAKTAYDELKASFDSLSGEIKKLKTARDKATDDDRLKKGEHEKLIAEKTAALEDLEAKFEKLGKVVEGYEKRDTQKADELLGSLPEDVQEKIKPFKDKMTTADWLDFLELQSGMYAGDEDGNEGGVTKKTTPPPTGSVHKGGRKTGRELSAPAKEILGELMRDREGTMTEKLTNRRSQSADGKGASAFTRSVESFFGDMATKKSEEMTVANANKRL